jgi:hypothetical protein
MVNTEISVQTTHSLIHFSIDYLATRSMPVPLARILCSLLFPASFVKNESTMVDFNIVYFEAKLLALSID